MHCSWLGHWDHPEMEYKIIIYELDILICCFGRAQQLSKKGFRSTVCIACFPLSDSFCHECTLVWHGGPLQCGKPNYFSQLVTKLCHVGVFSLQAHVCRCVPVCHVHGKCVHLVVHALCWREQRLTLDLEKSAPHDHSYIYEQFFWLVQFFAMCI
jgi:hypothetical protein